VKGFLQRRPIWLNRPLGLDAVRKFAEQMEYEMARFYRRAAQASDDTVIPLTPKSNVRSESGDPLDRAGKAILGLFHRAASDAEANDKHAVEMAHQLSAQLRAAEDRIRELKAAVRHHQDRADRAERWLYQVSVEIEQKFFGRDDGRPSRELEAHVRHHQERADRTERWLYQISVEIEQKFFGREEARSSRPPSPQASSGQNR
jgi:hypothetical protein